MKRREFLSAGTIAYLLLANGKIERANDYLRSAGQRAKARYRFVIASDGHYGQPDTPYQEYFSTLVERINEEHAAGPFAFGVINGDIIHDDKKHFTAAKKALDDLKVRYYVSQGNHDLVTAAEWERTWQMPVNLDFRMGADSFFVITTSNNKGEYLCPDMNWLQQKLEEHRLQENIFIFMHINPGKLTKYGVDCVPLFELFSRHKNIRAIFNGHDHDEDKIKSRAGIPFIFDGHFGGNWGTDYRGLRIVERLEDNTIVTYLLDPYKKINEDRLEK